MNILEGTLLCRVIGQLASVKVAPLPSRAIVNSPHIYIYDNTTYNV